MLESDTELEFIVRVLENYVEEINSFLEIFGFKLFFNLNNLLVLAPIPYHSILYDGPESNPYTLNGERGGYAYLSIGDRIQCKNHDITILRE